ncbi:Hypothetical protein, putative [Bodo saltans]|uniref:Leucine-rich repeat protein n=1 Tax=Bodo saltans TaxID=75058 RepID=A0A0S4IYW1_BODSA|nr:Hypothetical protein, putative [Bodo saltans]|eukprot:CUG01067.1 Hypothetical protein, putative [Bodo saltans]
MNNLRRTGITSITINVSNLQLSDRACVAVIETLLKLSNHPLSPADWVVNLSGNSFTDRVSGHLILLAQRCSKLVSLDISNTENVSAAAVAKVEGACKVAANARLELISGPPRLSRIDSLARTPRDAEPPSLADTASPPGAGQSNATENGLQYGLVDVAALKRRRDSMLRDEAAGSKGRQQSRTPNRGSSPTARQARQSSAEAVKRPSPLASTRAPSTSRTPKGSKLRPISNAPASKPSSAGPTARIGRPESSAGLTRATSIEPKPITTSPRQSASTSGKPQAKPDTALTKPASFQQKPAPTKGSPMLKPTPSATNAVIHKGSRVLNIPSSTTAKAAVVEDDRASVGSDATTATEVPDQQDFLDITANMNPMIDHVVSLEHQGVSSDVLIRRLKQALVAPPGSYSFASVTVLNLASNQLSSLEGALLPSTLLRVDLSDNQLTTIPSFAVCSMLAVANLRRNRIQKIGSAFEHNLNIGHLFLGRNELSFVDGIGHLWVLETLDLSCNKIASQVQLRPLSLNSALRHIVLKGNPLEKKLASYRTVLRNLVPSLIAVDNERLAFSRIAEARMNDDHQLTHNAAAAPSSSNAATHGQAASGTVGGYAVRNMLSKGLSGMASVYSEKNTIHASSKRIALNEKAKRHAAAGGAAGLRQPLSRREVVTKLCQQSKRFLEETIVERMTAAERRRELEGRFDIDPHLFGNPYGGEPTTENESGRTVESPADSQPGKDGMVVLADTDGDFEDGDAPFGHIAQWHREPAALPPKGRTASKSPSPAPERPQDKLAGSGHAAADTAQSVFDRLLGGSGTLPRAPTPKETSQKQPLLQHHPGAALANRHTASSRGRSRSNSNASSRSPSPNVGDGTKVLPLQGTLSASAKQANTPIRPAPQPSSAINKNRASKEPANYITPSRPLGRRDGPLTSPRPHLHDSDDEDEIVLSPEGASTLFPQDRGGKQVSPIRNNMDMTDLSEDGAHFANALVPRMDPGPAASPLPRSMRPAVVGTPIAQRQPPSGGAKRQGPIVSPRAEEAPVAVSRAHNNKGADTPPLGKNNTPSPGVVAWTQQFQQDLGAVQMSLKTVVDLVWSSLHASDSYTAERLAEERARCLSIITQSKMLDDTEVPIGVIRYFGFRPDELNDPNVARVSAETNDERGDLLESIHEMGSSKTCLRYLVALVDTGRDDLLRRYVEGIKEEMNF